jgi:hypothetical protein
MSQPRESAGKFVRPCPGFVDAVETCGLEPAGLADAFLSVPGAMLGR